MTSYKVLQVVNTFGILRASFQQRDECQSPPRVGCPCSDLRLSALHRCTVGEAPMDSHGAKSRDIKPKWCNQTDSLETMKEGGRLGSYGPVGTLPTGFPFHLLRTGSPWTMDEPLSHHNWTTNCRELLHPIGSITSHNTHGLHWTG